MERRHTPGPWFAMERIGGASTVPVPIAYVNGPKMVVDGDGRSVGFAPEDGSLIAASPDLLEVAKRLDSWWTESFPEGPDGDPAWAGGLGNLSDDTLEIWRAFRAAIAKAEGRS